MSYLLSAAAQNVRIIFVLFGSDDDDGMETTATTHTRHARNSDTTGDQEHDGGMQVCVIVVLAVG